MNCIWDGLRLANGEHNYADGSDFYFLAWDGAAVIEVANPSRYGWKVLVDATPAARAAAREWMCAQALGILEKWNHEQARVPREGADAVVVRGRKVKRGTVGRVEWIGPNRYDADNHRVRLQTADGIVHWTYINNLEAADASARELPAEWLTRYAADCVRHMRMWSERDFRGARASYWVRDLDVETALAHGVEWWFDGAQ